jgi:hypothetical protein
MPPPPPPMRIILFFSLLSFLYDRIYIYMDVFS